MQGTRLAYLLLIFACFLNIDRLYGQQSMFDLFKRMEASSHLTKVKVFTDAHCPLGEKALQLFDLSRRSSSKPPHQKGLWISQDNDTFWYTHQKIYRFDCDNLLPVDMSTCNPALKKTVNALIYLETKSSYARNIIRTLQESHHKFEIEIAPTKTCFVYFPLPKGKFGMVNNNAYAFQVLEKGSPMVNYAPFDQIGSGAKIRWTPKHRRIELAHELAHAYDANYGLVNDQLLKMHDGVMPIREIRAIYHENNIRKELKRRLRRNTKSGSSLVREGMPYTYPLPYVARH